VTRPSTVNRAILLAFCTLFAATGVWAEPPQDNQFQTDQLQTEQLRDDQPRPNHKKREALRMDPTARLRHTMRDEANNGLLGIISEGTDYTVDLALALAGDSGHLRLLPIAGAGALKNAEDAIFVRGIDFAIVQTDVLDDLRRNPPFPGVEKYLQYVTKLYDQELQVLAGPDVQSIGDLKGKKINFGLRDGGTYVTTSAVFKAIGVDPTVTTYPQSLALDKLRRGEISALAYVATKPSRLFLDIRPDESLHFVPITNDLAPSYTATTITSDDYPELVSKDAPVKTVAVGTVLLAYNWPQKSERYQRVNHFVQAFFTHLRDIKARRPRWQPFDVTASVSGWTRFPAAEQWVRKVELAPDGVVSRSAALGVTGGEASTPPPMPLDAHQRDRLFQEFAALAKDANDANQREALFRDFVEYQRRQHRIIVAYHGTVSGQ
jgi:uncharacterized protein